MEMNEPDFSLQVNAGCDYDTDFVAEFYRKDPRTYSYEQNKKLRNALFALSRTVISYKDEDIMPDEVVEGRLLEIAESLDFDVIFRYPDVKLYFGTKCTQECCYDS